MNTISPNRAVAVVCGMALASGALGQVYHVRDLGTPAGPSQGVSVNLGKGTAGFAIGSIPQGNSYRPFFALSGQAPTMVQPLAGDAQAVAVDIDSAGRAAANSYRLGEPTVHAFRTDSGGSTPTGGFQASACNDAGDVVGVMSMIDAAGLLVDHACLWRTGTTYDLGTLGGSNSYASAVNPVGAVAGKSFLAGDRVWRATLWLGSPGAPTAYNLGVLGTGACSEARGINSRLEVVGVSDTSTATGGRPRAFLAAVNSGGQVLSRTDLGALAGGWSSANAINNAIPPAVVGASDGRAVLWQGGVMSDLNSLIQPGSGWRLAAATDINDRGDIVGWGIHLGMPRAFLLERCPADVDGNGVAEPSDVARFVNLWFESLQSGLLAGDYDGNGAVEPSDVAALVSAWFTTVSGGGC